MGLRFEYRFPMARSLCFLLFDRFEDLFDVDDFGRRFGLDVARCRLDYLMAKGDLEVERITIREPKWPKKT